MQARLSILMRNGRLQVRLSLPPQVAALYPDSSPTVYINGTFKDGATVLTPGTVPDDLVSASAYLCQPKPESNGWRAAFFELTTGGWPGVPAPARAWAVNLRKTARGLRIAPQPVPWAARPPSNEKPDANPPDEGAEAAPGPAHNGDTRYLNRTDIDEIQKRIADLNDYVQWGVRYSVNTDGKLEADVPVHID